MVDKLPPYLQNRWRTDAVRYLKRNGCYPDINQLVDFIELDAEEANDPIFGTNTVKRDFKEKAQKFSHKGSASFVVQGNDDTKPLSGNQHQTLVSRFPPCIYCSGDHPIYVRANFKQLSVGKEICENKQIMLEIVFHPSICPMHAQSLVCVMSMAATRNTQDYCICLTDAQITQRRRW